MHSVTILDNISSAYNYSDDIEVIESLYNLLKEYMGVELDKLLEELEYKTTLQYIDALCYCYLRTIPHGGSSVDIDRKHLEYIQSFCSGTIEDYYKVSDLVYAFSFEGGVLYDYCNRCFIVRKAVYKDSFKPVSVHGVPMNEDIYYAYNSTFNPIQVAVDSLSYNGVYRDWINKYCENYGYDCKDLITAVCNILSHNVFWSIDNRNDVTCKFAGDMLMLDKGIYDLGIRGVVIQKVKYLHSTRRSILYLRLVGKIKDIDAVLDIENNMLIIPKDSSIKHICLGNQKDLKRKFLLNRGY